ncbi:MAG: DUF2809 domain-containing protein [Planctomycetota bacterium]
MNHLTRRAVYATCTVCVVLAGLGSREYADQLPTFLAAYAGDTLWAAMVYVASGIVFPTTLPRHRALGALTFSVAIELSQLYHAPWIDEIRATRLGALVLGFGFLWSDLACYAAGIALSFLIESAIHRKEKEPGCDRTHSAS